MAHDTWVVNIRVDAFKDFDSPKCLKPLEPVHVAHITLLTYTCPPILVHLLDTRHIIMVITQHNSARTGDRVGILVPPTPSKKLHSFARATVIKNYIRGY